MAKALIDYDQGSLVFVKAINESDQEKEVEEDQIDRLEKALSRILGAVGITRELSQVLAYAFVKGTVSYQEIKEVIKDDPCGSPSSG